MWQHSHHSIDLNLSRSKFQQSLFDDIEVKGKSAGLMKALDLINSRFGNAVIRSAATGTTQAWQMRSDKRSPNYTTRWDELPVAR